MANLSENSIRKACYRGGFADDKSLYIGTGNDVSLTWDGTDAHLSPAANNSVFNIGTGTLSFDVKTFGSAAGNYTLWDASANKFSLVGASILEMGTSSAKIVNDTASTRFLSLYTDCGATSGDSYGVRAAHYITGAGGGGAAMRPYLTVEGVTASNVYAIEATASISATANSTISGEMCVLKATADVNLTTAGTVNVLNLCINTAASKTMHADSAFIYLKNSGDGTDIANFINFGDARGGAGATTAMVCTDHANDITANLFIKCKDPTGTFYIMATSTAPAAS